MGSTLGGTRVGELDSYQWSVRIRCDTTELDDTVSVFVFCGNVPESPEDWGTSPCLVQECSFMVFAGGSTVEAFAHLSDFMLENARLVSLSEEVVIPYLQEKLNWRTKKADGTVVPSEEFQSLEVTVICTPYYKEPGQSLPRAGRVKEYPQVTYGRPGGSRHVPA